MRNKKILLLSALMAGSMLLASCDTVKAKLPTSIQSEVILSNADGVYNNEMEKLYEKVVPGDSSSAEKVLNSLLEKLAQGKFGAFYGEAGLRAAVADEAKLTAFVQAHSEMFATNDDARDFYDSIIKSIAKSMYSNVTNTSYQDRHYFVEKKFYDAQEEALYDLQDAYAEVLKTKVPVAVSGHKDYNNVEEYFGDATHNYLDVYQDYIERALLPDAYRTALVTKYIVSKNYGALGRSYARKVQYIALSDITESASAVRDLARAYGEIVISNDKAGVVAAVKEALGTDITLTDEEYETITGFDFLDDVYTGAISFEGAATASVTAVADTLYALANYQKVNVEIDGTPVDIRPWTEAGKLLKNYSELSTDRNKEGSTEDFTDSGKYTKQTGLIIKQREISTKSNIKDGWYTSNDLSELPSEIKSNLFKIQVANEVDSNYVMEGVAAKVNPNQKMDYGWYRQGSYYLVKTDRQSSDLTPFVMTSDGKTYIVKVEEAVKTSKLSSADNATNYKKLAELGVRSADQETLNQIVMDVADLLAGNDSYRKAARQAYVEAANITYHDQSVYDYFKSTFPDLFN